MINRKYSILYHYSKTAQLASNPLSMSHVVINNSGERSKTSSAEYTGLNTSSKTDESTSYASGIGSIFPIAFSSRLWMIQINMR